METNSVELKKPKIFLSYGHDQKNEIVVKRIKEFLSAQGYDVWLDSCDIPVGTDWRERIIDGLLQSDIVLSFLSKHYVRDPGVCLEELRIATAVKRAYIQYVLLEDENEVCPPAFVSHKQRLDMSDWPQQTDADFQEKMELLLQALRRDEIATWTRDLDYLSNKLNIVDTSYAQEARMAKALSGRQWLLDAVDAWLAKSDHRQMVIFGVPGAGKSTFSAYLAQNHHLAFATLFFKWDSTKIRTIDEVTRHLAFKLAITFPPYRRLLYNHLENPQKCMALDNLTGLALFEELIINSLNNSVDGKHETGMIVFDGLDETTPEITNFLIQYTQSIPSWIKVLFTSRYDVSKAARFYGIDTILLDQNHEQNTKDIREYLSLKLALEQNSSTLEQLVQKSEGSFMYAATVCNAIEAGIISVDDISVIPPGLNNFYHIFCQRIFQSFAFEQAEPLLEILCVEEDIPEEDIQACLGLSTKELHGLLRNLKSFVVQTEFSLGYFDPTNFKTIKLAHQTIKEWLTDPLLADEFYIDVSNGYRLLAAYSEEKSHISPIMDESFNALEYLRALAESSETPESTGLLEPFKKVWLSKYAYDHHMKWLILGGELDAAKKKLLNSYREPSWSVLSMDNLHNWHWADLFPLRYPVRELVEKLKEMMHAAVEQLDTGNGALCTQRLFEILCDIMKSGRYAPAFFEAIRLSPSHYLRTSKLSSMDYAWENHSIILNTITCVHLLQNACVTIPEDVLEECNSMKATFRCHINPVDHTPQFGILCDPELFKDLCIVDGTYAIDRAYTKGYVDYNTASLHFYLSNSDEEDMAFIQRCVSNRADLLSACSRALTTIKQADRDPNCIGLVQLSDVPRRIAFIESLKSL